MVQFGYELRLERERRGVSLEAMHASTKLSLHQLLDVEAGNFAELPGGIFRKGFVRSYVRALELDEASWLERFEISYRASGLAEATEADWASFAENIKNNRLANRRSSNRLKWLGVAGMALLLTLLSIVVWKFVLVPRIDTSLARPGPTLPSTTIPTLRNRSQHRSDVAGVPDPFAASLRMGGTYTFNPVPTVSQSIENFSPR